MTSSKRWLPVAVVAVAVMTMLCASQAGSTEIEIQLGDNFTGTIDVAGTDTVRARFFANQATAVTVSVRVDPGDTLRPTIRVLDPSGAPLDTEAQQTVDWLPVTNLVDRFTAPVGGNYVVEIGGTSGSGGFWAMVDGAKSDVIRTTLMGKVTNALNGEALEGVQVLLAGSQATTTDGTGHYSVDLAAGTYEVSFVLDDFETLTTTVDASSETPVTLDVQLMPLVPVEVNASISGDAVVSGTMVASVEILLPAGSMAQSVTWTQSHGVAAQLTGADTTMATVVLGDAAAYKTELLQQIAEPPIGEDQLPPNVPFPPGDTHSSLQDRFQVVPLNPFVIEETGLVELQVEVVTEFGTFTETLEVHTKLPWKRATGLRNVAMGHSVMLHGKEQAAYDWALVPPVGSLATLTDATTRNPYFTPDIAGLYRLEVTDEAQGGMRTIDIYAGTWRGVIIDQDAEGRPVADGSCTVCHNDSIAPDKFTSWAETGHAEIFTDNLNHSPYYGEQCFDCHTVGYDPEVDNGGVDEADDYQAFLDAGLIGNPGDNWTQMLEQFPHTAQMANGQCENCHGPQNTAAHGFAQTQGEPRIDISADVCAVCHGEPLRHARFQQWQLSGHSNYELAISRSTSGSCSRCHTANGFLTWLPILLDDDPETDPLDDIEVTWTRDEAHPATCATCHDPHASGNTSGSGTNATVRISGDTPPLIAGFTATDVGRGAICMTCHNSRRGLRNDDVYDDFVGTSEVVRAPHGSAQADVLMGQNAYLVPVGGRAGHSLTEDSCVDCHMEATPPPDDLAYNSGGSNHTFYAAKDICQDCHGPNLTAEEVQEPIGFLMDQVQALVEDGWLELMTELLSMGNALDLDGQATITDASQISALELTESRGAQALFVTLGMGEPMGPFRVSTITVLEGGVTDVGGLHLYSDPRLNKSGWNWSLFHNDGSGGVHNPRFASHALAAARDAMGSLSSGEALDTDAGEALFKQRREETAPATKPGAGGP